MTVNETASAGQPSLQVDLTLAPSLQGRLPADTPIFLVARVSAAGQATPQSGDLYGRLDDVSTRGLATVALDIDHAVP